jgi:hypothetical protein
VRLPLSKCCHCNSLTRPTGQFLMHQPPLNPCLAQSVCQALQAVFDKAGVTTRTACGFVSVLWCCRCCLGQQSLLCCVRHCVRPCPRHRQQTSSLCSSQPCCTQQWGGCLHPQGTQIALDTQAWCVRAAIVLLDTSSNRYVLHELYKYVCCVAAACAPAIRQLLLLDRRHSFVEPMQRQQFSHYQSSVCCAFIAGVGHGLVAELLAGCLG